MEVRLVNLHGYNSAEVRMSPHPARLQPIALHSPILPQSLPNINSAKQPHPPVPHCWAVGSRVSSISEGSRHFCVQPHSHLRLSPKTAFKASVAFCAFATGPAPCVEFP